MEELARAARELGIETRLIGPADDPAALARSSRAEALGVAGGDGSLAGVASAALERDVPFVCVPFGTRNHFARDLGLDRLDPIASLAAFDGEERRIDVGHVGERVFLNNVSLGLYAELVHRRERRRRRREAWAEVRAALLSLRERHPKPFVVNGETFVARVLLVANNPYSLELLSVGARDVLDSGRLHLYALEGWLPDAWSDRVGARFTIDYAGGWIRAAVDGEPERLRPPLEFSIEPRALRVLVPRDGG